MARNSSSIQLVFFNNGKRIKMATGMDIKPTMWVEDLMRARIHFSNPESNVINERLDALESAVNHIEYDIKMRRVNISSNEFIDRIKKRGQLFEFIKDGKEFWYHFEEFITHQKKHYSYSIYRDYHNRETIIIALENTLRHLRTNTTVLLAYRALKGLLIAYLTCSIII